MTCIHEGRSLKPDNKVKTDRLNCMATLSQAQLAYWKYELTGRVNGAETPENLRDRVDLIKWQVNQTAGRYIQAHEAVQHISIRRQPHAFMSEHGATLAYALAPELMHHNRQLEIIRKRVLDRAVASIREAL